MALQADADLVDESAGAVTLMTIHNAKGLEFDTVLITGLEEGLFPHVRSDTPEALEEERRLFYVGLTRARRTLVLTHAESRAMHGGRDYRLPSRFLGEIPPDCPGRAARRAAGDPVVRRRRRRPARGAALARHRGQRAARDVRRGRRHGDRERRRPGAGAVRAGRRRAPPDGRRRPHEKGVLMAATIIDGRAAAAELRAEVAEGVAAFRERHGRAPGLVGVQVGDDPASEIYQAGKAKAAEEAGMISRRVVLPEATTQDELDALIDELNADEAVDGMLVQLPVPDQLSEVAIANRIHPDKDVDGFSPINLGRLIRGEPGSVPCTPAGIMWLLDRAGVELEGAEAVVVGPQPDRRASPWPCC